MALAEFTLSNGMRFVVDENRHAPVVAFAIQVRAGGFEEPTERRGIAHLFEHLMFRGSEGHADGEHSATIERFGGQLNAFTGRDVTTYQTLLPSDKLATVFELEADRMRRLALTPDPVAIEPGIRRLSSPLQQKKRDPGSRNSVRFACSNRRVNPRFGSLKTRRRGRGGGG